MTAAPGLEEGTTDWLPAGEEPHPGGNIAHYVVLRADGTSVLSLPDGEIDSTREPGTGMYYRDTRYLSRLTLTFGGAPLVLLDAREVEHGLSAIFTNRALRTPGGRSIPAQSLVVRRRRVVTQGLLETLTISSYLREPIDLDLRFAFDVDFADIFLVRGFERSEPSPEARCETDGRCATYRYTGRDRIERTSRLSFHPKPASMSRHTARYQLHLGPRDTASLRLEVVAERELPEHSLRAAETRARLDRRAWLENHTRLETDDERVTQAVTRGLLDIEALRTFSDEGVEYVAAGVPWYDTLFGRDSLITGIELLGFCHEVTRTSLRTLANHQAIASDPVHDAAPGKIPHELRWSELSNTGEVPFGKYYGSVDATPLFVVAADRYVRWTGDVALIRDLWPNLTRAMEWCHREAAQGVRGFLSYARRSRNGLENQGWKDSWDAIVHPDGRLAEPPIALVEVQGYLAAAYAAYARLCALTGNAPALDGAAEASSLAERIDEAFGHPELGYALALDGHGEPLYTPASNAGHLLWSGIARRDLARNLSNRLFEEDMFSGWGIRTLSTTVPGFSPLGYHVGSVWPHDNALICNGLRLYGFDDEADLLATSMIQMVLGFPGYRVPELLSGDARDLRLVPTPYPVASRPQAWSAASLPFVMMSMLGIRPYGERRLAIVRPRLPANLQFVRVRGLRVAGGCVDLAFRRTGHTVSVEVEDIEGALEVVLSSSWPDELDQYLRH